MKLNKYTLLQALPKTKEVEIDGHGSVTVWGLTVAELLTFQNLQLTDPTKGGYFLVTCCVLGEDGKPIVSEADLPELQKIDAAVVNQLVESVLDVSGLLKTAAEKK